jgi:hypothetical protein
VQRSSSCWAFELSVERGELGSTGERGSVGHYIVNHSREHLAVWRHSGICLRAFCDTWSDACAFRLLFSLFDYRAAPGRIYIFSANIHLPQHDTVPSPDCPLSVIPLRTG